MFPQFEMGSLFFSEKRMEGEDIVRTVDSLRGRLLAERMVSRNAKDVAEQLGNKVLFLCVCYAFFPSFDEVEVLKVQLILLPLLMSENNSWFNWKPC